MKTLNQAVSVSGKVTKFIVTEKILGLITRLIDVGMIYIFVEGGSYAALKCFVLMTPINIIMTIVIIYLIDKISDLGFDITGIEELRKMEYVTCERKQYIKRLIRWVLHRKATIFWVGSWYYLDPDYVTLLIRDQKRSFWSNILRITIPSTVLAMIIWTLFYWAAYQGYQWVKVFTD